MALSFGVTVLPDPPYTRLIELIQVAEQQGFEYAWTYDSHVLWQESFPVMALVADRTSKIKLGHMVTNPGTREPTVLASAYATLHDISNGRMIMGIGRGDSARRYINQQPVKVAEFERALAMIKPFMNGKPVTWNEKELQLTWVRPELPEIEMHVAGYGPKALAKLRKLESIAVDQFNIYLMTHGQDEILEAYGTHIIPQLAGVAA